jgi:hypothetical protein
MSGVKVGVVVGVRVGVGVRVRVGVAVGAVDVGVGPVTVGVGQRKASHVAVQQAPSAPTPGSQTSFVWRIPSPHTGQRG